MYRRLPKFDPGAEHLVVRPFLFNGQEFEAGQSAKELPERKLRQLFETRRVSQHPILAPMPSAEQTKHKGDRHGRREAQA